MGAPSRRAYPHRRPVVVAGYTQADEDVAVACLNPDGSPDATFGAAGKATVDFGVATFGNAVALQPNGRIVVAVSGRAATTSR